MTTTADKLFSQQELEELVRNRERERLASEGGESMKTYPAPEIGFYQAECCLLDLFKIETQEDLKSALERVADNDEVGPLMVFPTLSAAIAALTPDGLSSEELQAEYKRLGWHVAAEDLKAGDMVTLGPDGKFSRARAAAPTNPLEAYSSRELEAAGVHLDDWEGDHVGARLEELSKLDGRVR